MAVERTKYWAIDENGDGDVDVFGVQGIVRGDFPLEPGDPAQVFSRASTFIGSVGDDGGLFDDNADNRVYFLSDSIQLFLGDELPEPDDGQLPGNDLPVISIAPDNADQDEGNEGTTDYTFTVTRTGDDLSAESTVDVAFVANGTNADDFGGTLPETQTVEFAADETVKTVTISVSGDTDFEFDETFQLQLEFATNAAIAPEASSANGTILNDDEFPADFNVIDGTDGPDILPGTDGNDIIRGFDDPDILFGNGGNDIMDGGDDEDVLFGGEGNDIMKGGNNSDVLFGGAGIDILVGGDGEDVLFGGEDNDVLTGGLRSDAFRFEGNFGNDVITDFDDNQDGVFFEGTNRTDIEAEVFTNGTLLTVESDITNGSVLLLGITELDEFNI